MANVSRIVSIILLLLTTQAGFASPSSGTFYISNDIKSAYDLVLQLRLDEAAVSLKTIQSTEPDNLMTHYVADFLDFFSVFISDDQAKYQNLTTARDTRLRLLSLGDVSSPYYLYVQAEVYIHRAILRLKFEENFAAASDLNQAFRLLKRNQRRFPDFTPNLKSLGMLKAAFGTIPNHYRWAVELLSSMEGTVGEGMADLKSALKDRTQFSYRETQYCYMFALQHFQNAPDAAIEYGISAGMKPSSNIIDCFVMSHVAMKSGKNDLALQWLEAKPIRAAVKSIPYLDLMYGTAKLHRLDKDADGPLLSFLDTYQGRNYRKEALQKLGWHALLHDNAASYKQYMTLCEHSGATLNESDKHAMAEACRVRVPHVGLLKARLLFDGGYYLKALEEVERISFDELSASGQLEYRYRSGRIYYELGREYDALFAYKMAISSGTDSKEYFGCAAALYAGLLYEKKADPVNAEMYYQICLNMNPEDYRSGLHQKAKAGISRLKVQ